LIPGDPEGKTGKLSKEGRLPLLEISGGKGFDGVGRTLVG